MRCCLRLLTYAVNLLLLISLVQAEVLTEEKVKEIARRELRKTFKDEVRLRSLQLYITGPVKFTDIERTILRAVQGQPRATLYLYLKTERGPRRVTASLNLVWRCSLWVARESIEPGERLYPWKVKKALVFKERCPRVWINNPDELINYTAIRRIDRNEPVKKGYLKREPLVRRGQSVRVVFREGNIEIELSGEALDTGFWGNLVRVKVGNGRVLRGRVEGENLVSVK